MLNYRILIILFLAVAALESNPNADPVQPAMIYRVMPETKVFDDTWPLSTKYGNGLLRHEVWVNEQGQVSRYNLAYINHLM